jgi:hypothetical protein
MIGHEKGDQASRDEFFGPALSPERALRQPLIWSQDEQLTRKQR